MATPSVKNNLPPTSEVVSLLGDSVQPVKQVKQVQQGQEGQQGQQGQQGQGGKPVKNGTMSRIWNTLINNWMPLSLLVTLIIVTAVVIDLPSVFEKMLKSNRSEENKKKCQIPGGWKNVKDKNYAHGKKKINPNCNDKANKKSTYTDLRYKCNDGDLTIDPKTKKKGVNVDKDIDPCEVSNTADNKICKIPKKWENVKDKVYSHGPKIMITPNCTDKAKKKSKYNNVKYICNNGKLTIKDKPKNVDPNVDPCTDPPPAGGSGITCGLPNSGYYYKKNKDSNTKVINDKDKECFHKCPISINDPVSVFKKYGLDVILDSNNNIITISWSKLPTHIDINNVPNYFKKNGWSAQKDKVTTPGVTLSCKKDNGKLAYYIDYSISGTNNNAPGNTVKVKEDLFKEGFENYVPQPVKDVFDWIAGRPDINDKSKVSLLPGFEF